MFVSNLWRYLEENWKGWIERECGLILTRQATGEIYVLRKKGRKRKTVRIRMQVSCIFTSWSKGIREMLFLWLHLRIIMVWGEGSSIFSLSLELEEELSLGHQKPPGLVPLHQIPLGVKGEPLGL